MDVFEFNLLLMNPLGSKVVVVQEEVEPALFNHRKRSPKINTGKN
jgi:hypothetical protein